MSRKISHRQGRTQAWNPYRARREEWFQEDLAMAKVDKKLKKELRTEMEIIREGKNKRKHKNRSKKRGTSSDATFSTDSDREQRRTPPKQTKAPKKDEATKLTTEQLYDIVMKTPEKSIPFPSTFHPNGSALILTSSKVQITTRSNILNLQAQILTQQSHQTILQLFNPGMAQLLINKDKKQTQIIDHLLYTTKKYKFLLCWLEPASQEGRSELEKVIAEANSQGRILGWQNQDVKMHFLTLRQLRMVEKMVIPSGLLGFGEKLVMIVQYPQTILNIRHKYQPFYNITVKEPLNTTIHTRPDYSRWDQSVKEEPQTTEQGPSLPDHIQKIKDHFGIMEFQPILSDEEDNKQPAKDLASELLDALKSFPSPAEQYPRQFHNNYYNMMYQVPMQAYNPFNPITGKFTFAFKYNPTQHHGQRNRNGHEHLNASYSINAPYHLGYQQ